MLLRISYACGLFFALTVFPRIAQSFAVFGYVPEYRFPGIDWDGIVERTTHLLLFSAEPTADGDLDGMDRFWLLRKPGSGLRKALTKVGDAAPKVLLSIGGGGRSEHFGTVANNKKVRKKFADRIVRLLVENPVLAGVDLDWEAPKSVDEWRDFGKLVAEVRAAFNRSTLVVDPMLTMSFHPSSGAVAAFSGLKSKENGMPFFLHFDFCHAMAYSLYDQEKRHSTQKLAKLTVDEWTGKGLPLGRLTLGLPFYGISRTSGQPETYAALLDREPQLKEKLSVDETTEGRYYFNNAETLSKKVRYAARRKLGGVMIWELGQDKAASNPNGGSLLRHVWDTVQEVAANASTGTMGAASSKAKAAMRQQSAGYWGKLLDFNPFTEDNIIAGLSGLIGMYFFLKAVIWNVPVRDRAPWGPEGPPERIPFDADAYNAEDTSTEAPAKDAPAEPSAEDAPAEPSAEAEDEAGEPKG